jgi:mono/diheme cytochrome c family protein
LLHLSPAWKTWLIALGVVLLVIGAIVGYTAWYRFFRVVDDGPFASDDERFLYGSIGAEAEAGLPYWIWVAMPRVCSDLLPGDGQGGYRAFGIPWVEGHEMPAGFTKKTIGFPRVANNCAICHAQSYRLKANETSIIVPVGSNHTFNTQAMLRFLTNCAADPRFNADTLLAEIEPHANFDWIDKLAWRFAIIPRTKTALLSRQGQFAWMNRPGWPDWGPGRDDPMNLTKYFMTSMPVDNSVGSADFPSIWNLGLRQGKNLNWGGETPAPISVIIDSALGLQADPKTVVAHANWILGYASKKRPPKFPFPVDGALAQKGKALYDAQCSSCHAIGAPRTGTVIPAEEVGTDRNRLDTWTQAAADQANAAVDKLGIKRVGLIKTNGYQAVPLDGIWLRAPYFHNGSVPNLREVLEPEANRSKIFYRGYDVYDPVNMGFDTQSAEAQKHGFKIDTSVKGNGNQGHLYGTTLPAADKTALIEYMKTIGPVEGEP